MTLDSLLRKSHTKARLGGVVLAVVVLSLFAVINAPFEYADVGGSWEGTYEEGSDSLQLSDDVMPRMAGWPFRYWVQYTIDDVADTRHWSWLSLCLNVIAAICAAVSVFGFVLIHSRQVAKSRTRKGLFDVGIAGAILIVPAIVLLLQYRVTQQHMRLASQVNRIGNSYTSSWIPKCISDQVPKGIVEQSRRNLDARGLRFFWRRLSSGSAGAVDCQHSFCCPPHVQSEIDG
jgi:hypothetical protein